MNRTYNPETMVTTLTYERDEFTKILRQFSDNATGRKIDRDLWKRIKRHAIDNSTISISVAKSEYEHNICFRARSGPIKNHTYSSVAFPSLTRLTNYIFGMYDKMFDVSTKTQGTSSAAYDAKAYTLKADYMSSGSANTCTANTAKITNVAKQSATAVDGLGSLTLDLSTNTINSAGKAISSLNDLLNDSITISPQPIGVDWDKAITTNDWCGISITTETDALRKDIESIKKSIEKLTVGTGSAPVADTDTVKENKSMFNFDFGKVTSDSVRVSMYGIAVKSVDGKYVSYDAKTHSVMDVEIMNMPAGDFLYKMPVAIKDIKAGDVVIHNRVPMFVVDVHESTLKVIDIREGTEKEIYLTKSPFGFNFATKVISLMDMTGNKADESNPFGAMLPFMLMGDNKEFDPMMLMLMGGGKFDTSNPMMMYFLMKDTNQKDMLPLMLMMNAKG